MCLNCTKQSLKKDFTHNQNPGFPKNYFFPLGNGSIIKNDSFSLQYSKITHWYWIGKNFQSLLLDIHISRHLVHGQFKSQSTISRLT